MTLTDRQRKAMWANSGVSSELAFLRAEERNRDQAEADLFRNSSSFSNTLRVPSRKCTFCGSTVTKSRAREQQGERFQHAPFCRRCEREFT